MLIIYHLLALTIAFVIDAVIGDPKNWPHPVRWMGSMIGALERRLNGGKFKKEKGVIMLLLVLISVLTVTIGLLFVLYSIHPLAGIIGEAVCISIAIAKKSLMEAGMEVYHPLVGTDLEMARLKLSYIVGRDTDDLFESEIVRGTVETIAENTSDGVTAPMFWAAIGGAPLALAYRMINTCDSMVGYRSERYEEFGWASARMDDLVNWIPSRLTGMLILLSEKTSWVGFKARYEITVRDARKHPSPNSGWCEAAVASVMGVQLGGINHYKGVVSNRAKMGEYLKPLKAAHILASIKLMERSSLLFLLLLWIGGILFEMASSWF